MNNQEILDNAPEGATHIDDEHDFCKEGYYFSHTSQRWMTSEYIVGSRSLADIKRIAELEKELESALYFNIDVVRCLSKIAWEHNHDEIPAYMQLASECIKSIESKQFEALKEQVK